MPIIHNITNVASVKSVHIAKQSIFSYKHHSDCDTVYSANKLHQEMPVHKFVCNYSETHNIMPDVRHCLQTQTAQGHGFVESHYVCFKNHFTGSNIDGYNFGL